MGVFLLDCVSKVFLGSLDKQKGWLPPNNHLIEVFLSNLIRKAFFPVKGHRSKTGVLACMWNTK